MKTLGLTPPCVIAHDRETCLPISGLQMQSSSEDKVPHAAMQVAYFLMHHTDSEPMTRALSTAIYVHWLSDGTVSESFEFPPNE